jgi:glycosyltransferase involved in cell wall biosynthesis
MRSFDVFAFPTRAEPFGKAVIEAMAAGCPVVASRVGGVPEIVSDPSLGTLIPPDDPQMLAEAILGYLCDAEGARRTGAAGCRHVMEEFGLERMVQRLQDLYDTVLSGRVSNVR